jgi:hypothetical protein
VTALALTALAAGLAGCGKGQSGDDPSSLVPSGSALYADVVLDPEGSQEEAVRELVARFPGGDEGAGDLIQRAIESGDGDVSYEDDIESWLGDDAAFFLSDLGGEVPEAAAIIATTDSDKFMDLMKKDSEGARERSYEGVDYLVDDGTAAGVVEGHGVIGSEPGLRAVVDAREGESFEADADYRKAVSGLPDERLATMYFDFRKLFTGAGVPREQVEPLLKIYKEPFAAGVTADGDSVAFEAAVPRSLAASFGVSPSAANRLIEELPSGSWFAAAQMQLGKQFETSLGMFSGVPGAGFDFLERELRKATGLGIEELVSWMGDAGFFARGTSLADLGAGLVVETNDQAASRRAIGALRDVLARELDGESARVAPLALPGGGEGFTIVSDELPGPIHVVQRGDRVAAALGDEAASEALAPTRTLADDENFRQAQEGLDGEMVPWVYLEFAPILELAESFGAAGDKDYQSAKPYLRVFDHLIAGAEAEGDPLRSSLVLGLD